MEPLFHFCTYAYILTRRGAEKLLRSLQKGGCTTSIDHYLNSSRHGLVKYVMQDLIATCFQENDEAYKASQFDNFQRVDTFDSDIWNNKDCFENIVQQGQQEQQPLWNVLTDVLKQAPHSIQTRNTLRESAVQEATNGSIVYRLGQDGTMEGAWLRSMLPSATFQTFTDVEEFKSGAYILVARPNMEFWTRIASELNAAKKPFRILHLSDEIGADPLDLYNHPFCKGVVRNYARNDARLEFIFCLSDSQPLSKPITRMPELFFGAFTEQNGSVDETHFNTYRRSVLNRILSISFPAGNIPPRLQMRRGAMFYLKPSLFPFREETILKRSDSMKPSNTDVFPSMFGASETTPSGNGSKNILPFWIFRRGPKLAPFLKCSWTTLQRWQPIEQTFYKNGIN